MSNVNEIINVSTIIVNIFKNAFKILNSNSCSDNTKNVWINYLKKNLRLFNHLLHKNKNLSIGCQKKLLSNISHLKTFRIRLKQSYTHAKGGSLQKNKRKDVRSSRVKWEEIKTAFSKRIRTGVIINLKHIDIFQFLEDAFFLFKSRIKNILKSYATIKVNSCFCGEFIKADAEKDVIDYKYFNTQNVIIDRGTNLNEWFKENIIDKILNKLEEFQEKQSGFALKSIHSLEINVNKCEVGNGSSYIRLPNEIISKQACINVKNYDNACFAWAIVSALYPSSNHSDRISSYPHYSSVLNLQNIEFPISLKDITKVEKLNEISINVYMLETIENCNNNKLNFKTVPARLTKNKLEKHVNLLLVQDVYYPSHDYEDFSMNNNNDNYEIKYHYVWIKSLSRLISSQTTKHKCKIFICDRCLNYFSSQEKLNAHEKICLNKNDYKISFPKYDYIEFKNFINKEKLPYIVYSDFESLLRPINDEQELTKNTKRYQKHVPFSAGYYFSCSYDQNLSYYRSYRGKNCMQWFANQIEEIGEFVSSKLIEVTPMNSTVNLNSINIEKCHICEKAFSKDDTIVRDHCHRTGNFRGYAHNKCNLNYKESFVIPFVFHNFSGYDSHFIIKDLAKRGAITLLPINKEKYISFTLCTEKNRLKFRFIDSFRFLGTSLDNLASLLTEFPILTSEFKNIETYKIKFLQRKGIFPYDFLDSFEKLDNTNLPPLECFYNKLNDTKITNDDYNHAQRIWNLFNCQNLGEYSDLYLKTDILLLAEAFEQFRTNCLDSFSLDPGRYYSLPGYTWDCMLKYTKCKLQVVKDVDMILFLESGVRGGISQCCNRFSEANNKYIDNYDSSKPSKYLIYVDVNNLYGWSMCQYLPYDGFEWEQNLSSIDVMKIPNDSPIGYIMEVDLEYPSTIHDKHKDLPFCASHSQSPHSKYLKLMTTLHNKSNYIIYYQNLKQALSNGLILKKIHRVLKFKQSPWLKPYVDLITNYRKLATSSYKKDQFKLLINACFGKALENIRKRRNVKLVNKWEGRYGAKNLIASPNFHNRSIFDENLMAIELKKTELIFNKPIYVGMAVLDISKVCIYDFHYNYIIPKFSENRAKILYMDTDSFFYEIICDDVYKEVFKCDIHMFDTSDYPTNNVWDIPQRNKKVLGLMKDEVCGKIITHFVGLRSKMYTYKTKDQKCVKKSKGIKCNIVKNVITFDDYVNCLRESREKVVCQNTIHSIAHNVYSIQQNKIGLSPFDDKRFIFSNSYDTLPWGHYRITSFS